MTITINISQEQERTLRNALGPDIDRAALEGLVIEGYRAARLSAGEVAELLGLGSSLEAVSWLGGKEVFLNYSLEDFESDCLALEEDFSELRR